MIEPHHISIYLKQSLIICKIMFFQWKLRCEGKNGRICPFVWSINVCYCLKWNSGYHVLAHIVICTKKIYFLESWTSASSDFRQDFVTFNKLLIFIPVVLSILNRYTGMSAAVWLTVILWWSGCLWPYFSSWPFPNQKLRLIQVWAFTIAKKWTNAHVSHLAQG